MPSGDRQRTWFPEMIEVLRARWRPEMSCADVVELRDDLDDMLSEIRRSRNLKPVTSSSLCPCCNEPMVQGAAGVSVRATILAFGRFGIASVDEVKALEKAWNKVRRQTGADLNGKHSNNNATCATEKDGA